jgi:hypothetical protein
MCFVHVIAGFYGGVMLSQFERTLRVTLEVHAKRLSVKPRQGKYLSHHLKYQRIGAEG